MREFKITIPKIEFTIKVEEVLKKKEDKKEEVSDYYFVTLHNDIKHKKITLLTVQDCLTVSIFSLYKIDKSDLTSDTLCGFNHVIPNHSIVFLSYDFKFLKNRIMSECPRILTQLLEHSESKRLFKTCTIDVVSLNTKRILWSYNLAIGKEVVIN